MTREEVLYFAEEGILEALWEWGDNGDDRCPLNTFPGGYRLGGLKSPDDVLEYLWDALKKVRELRGVK